MKNIIYLLLLIKSISGFIQTNEVMMTAYIQFLIN